MRLKKFECNASAEFMKDITCEIKHFNRNKTLFTIIEEFSKPIHKVNVINVMSYLQLIKIMSEFFVALLIDFSKEN